MLEVPVKHKTAELEGLPLNLAVALAEDMEVSWHPSPDDRQTFKARRPGRGGEPGPFLPSTDWAHGGPLVERERGSLFPELIPGAPIVWVARMGDGTRRSQGFGPTPLVAAMRAFVASKLGDEVDLA
jgi:hypothetical protein